MLQVGFAMGERASRTSLGCVPHGVCSYDDCGKCEASDESMHSGVIENCLYISNCLAREFNIVGQPRTLTRLGDTKFS